MDNDKASVTVHSTDATLCNVLTQNKLTKVVVVAMIEVGGGGVFHCIEFIKYIEEYAENS